MNSSRKGLFTFIVSTFGDLGVLVISTGSLPLSSSLTGSSGPVSRRLRSDPCRKSVKVLCNGRRVP